MHGDTRWLLKVRDIPRTSTQRRGAALGRVGAGDTCQDDLLEERPPWMGDRHRLEQGRPLRLSIPVEGSAEPYELLAA